MTNQGLKMTLILIFVMIYLVAFIWTKYGLIMGTYNPFAFGLCVASGLSIIITALTLLKR